MLGVKQDMHMSAWKKTLIAGLISYIDAGSIVAGASGLSMWADYLGMSSGQNQESKLRIADAAHPLIHEGDTIMVDSSTTCQMLLSRLVKKANITVITNSVRLMYDFRSSDFRMICTGGNFRASSCSLTGPAATRMLAGYHADYTIISCKALDLAKGLMESNESESEVKEVMMRQARSVILLADHSKFDKTALVHFGDIRALSYLAADREPSEEWKRFLDEHDVKLLV